MPRGLNLTTAEDVLTAWAPLASLLDPTHSFDLANDVLRVAHEHDDLVAQAIAHMAMVDESVGRLLDPMDYGFCRDRRLWSRGNEAVLQARVLQQVLVWAQRSQADRQRLQRLVARYTFNANLADPTPRLLLSGDIRFVVVPFVYGEILLLPAAALAEATGASWSCMGDPATAGAWSDEAPKSFRKLMARVLANSAFDVDSEDENPIATLSRDSAWFRGIDDATEPCDLADVLANSGQDYALAHEIGHAATEGDYTDPVDIEMAADVAGFRLFAASWHWRDELLDPCPLGSSARILLGPIWFFFTAALLFHLRQSLRSLVRARTGDDAASLVETDGHHQLSILHGRWGVLQGQLSAYTQALERLGEPIDAADHAKLAHLIGTLHRYMQLVPSWAAQVPDEDFKQALGLTS